jgi:hypothetical protein
MPAREGPVPQVASNAALPGIAQEWSPHSPALVQRRVQMPHAQSSSSQSALDVHSLNQLVFPSVLRITVAWQPSNAAIASTAANTQCLPNVIVVPPAP